MNWERSEVASHASVRNYKSRVRFPSFPSYVKIMRETRAIITEGCRLLGVVESSNLSLAVRGCSSVEEHCALTHKGRCVQIRPSPLQKNLGRYVGSNPTFCVCVSSLMARALWSKVPRDESSNLS